jgi:DNA polymerase
MNAESNPELDALTGAARQLLAIEQLLGADHMPTGRITLPEVTLPPPQDPPGGPRVLYQRKIDAPPPPGQHSPAMAPVELPPVDLGDKPASMEAIDSAEVRGCTRCLLHQSRSQTVFGEGDPDADLVFVGEGPGADEDRTGRPFVGRAGQLLTKMITAMGLSRERVYICNLVKCRPPGNRTPLPDEVDACWSYLLRQLQILQPAVIVTLGNPATKQLLQTRTGITRLRGNWQRLPALADGLADIPVMPTFHPSYVLRRYTAEVRGQVWGDLQQVMAQLGLQPPRRS